MTRDRRAWGVMSENGDLSRPGPGNLPREPRQVIEVNRDDIFGRDELPTGAADPAVIRHCPRRTFHRRVRIAQQCKVGSERAAQQPTVAEGQNPLLGKAHPGSLRDPDQGRVVERGAI
ncbi:hypothetical protein SAMN04489859_10843 [Paracoccus alcaliphilus]|uniref:Uncharacterized protein n=1 Tax=Paracoccus alcaliphilus TaxID=34002 RepID=A0A1H8P834_9RHOB|nr:hypothetical protein [Paracoccus alcaliphilus]SEO37947.1 hypothetical protein SAMN04489859_10843 [Paracoccus alcaliphilus]